VAVNGTTFFNLVDNSTIAQIENGAVIDVASGLVFDPNDKPPINGSVIVDATDNSYVIGIVGNVAISEATGIGASVGINVVLRDTEAVIGDLASDATSGTIGSFSSGGDVVMNAENGGFIGNFAVAGSVVMAKNETAAIPETKPKHDDSLGGTQGSDGSSKSNKDWERGNPR